MLFEQKIRFVTIECAAYLMGLKNFNKRFLISFHSSLIFNFENMYLLLFFPFVMEKKKKEKNSI